jgi:hypothetical protein
LETAVTRKAAIANGRERLEEAMAVLLHNEAAIASRLAEIERRHLEFTRETAERFARIEAQMAEIIRVLAEHGRLLADHSRLLERLPEAIRDKLASKDNK